MKLEEIYSKYALNDGETKSFKIDFSNRSCSVRLLVRKAVEKQKFQKCEIELIFSGVINIDFSEDFRTTGGFSDITFTKTFNGNYYLSLDPYGNTGEPHENDNFIIISSSLNVTDENNEKIEVT
jgi:hypothetical protein